MSSQNGNHVSTGDSSKAATASSKRQSDENHHQQSSDLTTNLKRSKPHHYSTNNTKRGEANGDSGDLSPDVAVSPNSKVLGGEEDQEIITTYDVDESTGDSERQVYLEGDEGEEEEEEDELDDEDLGDLPERFRELQWEDPYVRKMAEFVGSNGGKILQVGFGTGVGATALQDCPSITEHVIVEDDEELMDFLESWASEHPNVTILKAPWEEATKNFPDDEFDGVLFYLHPHLPEIQHTSQFDFISKSGYRILKKGGHLSYCNLRSWDDHMKKFESDVMKMFEETQIEKLREVGFNDDNIEFEVQEISVPEDCKYYSHEQVLLVKLTK